MGYTDTPKKPTGDLFHVATIHSMFGVQAIHGRFSLATKVLMDLHFMVDDFFLSSRCSWYTRLA